MLIAVLVCNTLIGLCCLVAAWQLWQLKQRLAKAANTLSSFERKVHRVLHPAPDVIGRGHAGIHQLREQYRGLEPQLQRAQQALALLSLGQTLWQRRFLITSRSRDGRSRDGRSRDGRSRSSLNTISPRPRR